jgi:hypothetical protein
MTLKECRARAQASLVKVPRELHVVDSAARPAVAGYPKARDRPGGEAQNRLIWMLGEGDVGVPTGFELRYSQSTLAPIGPQ